MSTPNANDLWSTSGAMATHFPDYEPREPQQTMYHAVKQAVENSGHLVVEAGTGTGKGLAYILPIILHSIRHPDARYVISTATIGLQQQLAHKDVPNAVAALENAGIIPPGQFTWTVLKGKSNYLCHSRAESFAENIAGQGWQAATNLARKIEKWRTRTGDRSELDLKPDEQYPWFMASAQFHSACPYYHESEQSENVCYLKQARRKAKESNLTIVNHALFFADLANHEPNLGHASYVVIDEAQRIEEIASGQFGWELEQNKHRQDLEAMSQHPTLEAVANQAITAWREYWDAINDCIEETEYRQDTNTRSITPNYRNTPEWRSAIAAAVPLQHAVKLFLESINGEINRAKHEGHAAAESELAAIRDSNTEQIQSVSTLMDSHDPTKVCWLERSQTRGTIIRSIPLFVGDILQERLFSRKQSVVLTSATLTTDGHDFSMIRRQTGFPDAGHELAVDSPFDYANQAQFISPSDLPNPKDFRQFGVATAECLSDVARQLDGRTLALFTSYAALNQCAKLLREELPHRGIQVLAQGSDGSPESIIQQYRANPRAIILGAATFWEGVDFGDLLHAVAICRLPFPVPTDPVIQARSALYQDAFNQYHVPLALLRFKQGCGRLIRRNSSVGSIIVLDPRIRHSRYGARFYHSLPPCSPVKSSRNDVGSLAADWVRSASAPST